jgi:hypothetical protein
MQGANGKTGKLPKKPKLVTDEATAAEVNTNENSDYNTIHERPIIDKTLSYGLVGDDRTTRPATLETTNNPTVTKPNIIGFQEPLGKREDNDGVIAGSALAGLVEDGGRILASDLSAITHADGLAILDEYFPKSATGLGPSGRILIPELPTPPASVALPGSPGVVQTPSAGPDVEVLKKPETPYPERAVDNVEACGSSSYSESPRSVSSCVNPTRCPSYETNATDIDSLDMAAHPPFTKRVVLDDGPHLLEHVLVALDSAYDDRCAPTSCVPGVLDKVYTTSDQEIFVKIMTSITENWAKCNRLIARPALEVAQERLAEIEHNGSSRRRGDLSGPPPSETRVLL